MIQEQYTRVLNTFSDIQDNLSVLNYFAKQCRHITEMGVRSMVSSWAFLEGLRPGGTLVGIDIVNPSQFGVSVDEVTKGCLSEGVTFKFVQGSTLELEIEPTDFLFIDTIHTKEQLSKELTLHAHKARRFLAFHDTVSCPELIDVINEFLEKNKDWLIVFQGTLSNGLVVLQKNA